MLIDFLGKIFFSGQQPWQRRREMKNILFAIAVGFFLSAFAGVLILFKNHLHP